MFKQVADMTFVYLAIFTHDIDVELLMKGPAHLSPPWTISRKSDGPIPANPERAVISMSATRYKRT